MGREPGRRRWWWWLLLLVVYLIAAGYSVAHHELWGDEIHSWNIAKASSGWRELVANTRYEGHPPAWYAILSVISRFTHRLSSLQAAGWAIGGGVVALVVLAAPFPFVVKALLPFGYYFWFEYGTLARNYALGILLVFGACVVLLGRPFRGRIVVYYGLLTLASNTHLLALLLAGSLHVGWLLRVPVRGAAARRGVALQILVGGLVMLPAACFIFPPADSGMNAGFWVRSWQAARQLDTIVRAPLRAFLPIPAWWRPDFWNTEFLVELGEGHGAVRLLIPFVSLALVLAAFVCLRPVRASLLVFGANLLATCALAATFPLTTARYTGFIYIGFLVAYWLRCHEASGSTPAARLGQGRSGQSGQSGRAGRSVLGGNGVVVVLLLLQVAGGVFAVSRDARSAFSEAPRVGELIAEVPPGAELVTDVWTEDTVVAFTDRPLPCLGLDRPVAFLRWDTELEAVTPTSYSVGLRKVFLRAGGASVYLVSSQSPRTIFEIDPAAEAAFTFTLVDRREGAIERWSNLYLYRITARPAGHASTRN